MCYVVNLTRPNIDLVAFITLQQGSDFYMFSVHVGLPWVNWLPILNMQGNRSPAPSSELPIEFCIGLSGLGVKAFLGCT